MTAQHQAEAADAAYREAFDQAGKAFAKPGHYLEKYKEYLAPFAGGPVRLLELGVFEGDSLEFFSRVLPDARVFGVDLRPCARVFSTARVKIYQGSQEDPALFQRLMAENDLHAFDVIIDDCSHMGSLSLNSFNLLFPFLRPGGLYVIEDWGTGYWRDWPDGKAFDASAHLTCLPRCLQGLRERLGKLSLRLRFATERMASHHAGMPGFIKQLVDEVAMVDITNERGLGTNQAARIDYLHVYPGIAFMRKSADPTGN